MLLENCSHFQEKIGLEESLVRAVVRPGTEEAGVVAVAEPVGDLLDGGLLQIVCLLPNLSTRR